jgi:hypothetical protein
VIKQTLDKALKSKSVEKVKHISKGGLLIGCSTPEESEDIINTINNELETDFKAKKLKRNKPKIIVFGVSGEVSEQSIVNEIIESNREIKAYLSSRPETESIDSQFICKFKFRRKIIEKKSSKETQEVEEITSDHMTEVSSETQTQRKVEETDKYVIEVSPQMRKIIFNLRSIKIGWSSHRYADYLPLVRCHKCNNFGHFKKDCKAAQACGNCGKDHNTRVCKAHKTDFNCINCYRYNNINKSGKKVNTGHSSFSDSCESLKRIINLIKEKIDYE